MTGIVCPRCRAPVGIISNAAKQCVRCEYKLEEALEKAGSELPPFDGYLMAQEFDNQLASVTENFSVANHPREWLRFVKYLRGSLDIVEMEATTLFKQLLKEGDKE